jgi:hypothetical protein
MTAARPDPQLEELSEEFGTEWRVWRPGRYVADHPRLDVALVSDTVPSWRTSCVISSP